MRKSAKKIAYGAVGSAILLTALLGCGSSSEDGPDAQPAPTQQPAPTLTGPGPSPDPNMLPAPNVTVGREQIIKKVVGLDLNAATQTAHQAGYTVRLSQINGVDQTVTTDYSETRLNLKINEGQVIGATVG